MQEEALLGKKSLKKIILTSVFMNFFVALIFFMDMKIYSIYFIIINLFTVLILCMRLLITKGFYYPRIILAIIYSAESLLFLKGFILSLFTPWGFMIIWDFPTICQLTYLILFIIFAIKIFNKNISAFIASRRDGNQNIT